MKMMYYFNEDEYEYEINYRQMREYLRTELNDLSHEELVDMLLDFDEEEMIKDYFEDACREYFEDEAREAYDDACEYEKDPLGYYGMSRSDFV